MRQIRFLLSAQIRQIKGVAEEFLDHHGLTCFEALIPWSLPCACDILSVVVKR